MTYKPSQWSLTSAFWTQAAWFIDPSNSTGVASDNNTGLDSAHPLFTWNGGPIAKFGTESPILKQKTIFTFLSSQPNESDPVTFTPTLIGVNCILQGTLGAGQLVVAGVLGAVTAKNRATNQLLTANLGALAGAAQGQIVENTTAGKASFAVIEESLGGGVFVLSQPITAQVVPPSDTNFPSEINTWAIGDTVILWQPPAISVARLGVTSTNYNPATFSTPLTIYRLTFLSTGGLSFSDAVIESKTSLVECSVHQHLLDNNLDESGVVTFATNCFFADVHSSSPSQLRHMFGGCIYSNFNSNISWQPDYDAILHGNNIFCKSNLTTFGTCAIVGTTTLWSGACAVQSSAAGGSAFVWGSGTFNVGGTTRLYYTAPAVNKFNAILNINGQANVSAFNPISGTYSAGVIALSPANLDLAFGGGGFGGLAVNVGGGSISSQSTA